LKYRLIELLQCPEHPEAMFRVISARISEIFPCAVELHTPYCRAGCGLLGNWFTEIPQNLPQSHRIDCRRCLGMEIETATLSCPVCDAGIRVESGVLLGQDNGGQAGPVEALEKLPAKTGAIIERLLDLQPADMAVILAPVPDETDRKWSESGVERLFVETDHEALFSHRARTCANGEGFTHYLAGPIDISLVRPGQYDAIIALIPTDRWKDSPGSLESMPSLLRPSGRMLLLFEKDRGNHRHDPGGHVETLPASFHGYDRTAESTREHDLVLLTPPRPSPVRPVVPETSSEE
jgi:hypothetical protein